MVAYKNGFPLASLIVLLVVNSQSLQHGLSASKMKYSLGFAAFAALVAASPTPTLMEKDVAAPVAACASAVTIAPGSNPFASRTLHANSAYRSEITAAMESVTDDAIKTQASAVANTGTFLWM